MTEQYYRDEPKEVEITGLELYLTQHSNQPFDWGWNDCNTFIVEYVDFVKGTRIINEVKGKYWDAKSAFRFTRDYKKLDAGLAEAGFVEVEELEDGDIVTYENRGFVCGHIYAYKRMHSMDVDHGYMSIPSDQVNLADPKLKIWRYNG
jgi:hypothetical protein